MGVVRVLVLKELVPRTCAHLCSDVTGGPGPRATGEPSMMPVPMCRPCLCVIQRPIRLVLFLPERFPSDLVSTP